MNALLERSSWCGETHIQKSAYFVQEVAAVDLGAEFILYKFGPFSFDLRDQIARMRSEGFIDLHPNPPYGPSLRPSHFSEWLASVGLVERGERDRIDAVADFIGGKGVTELERLATALYALRTMPDVSQESRAAYIHSVKPHVSVDDAMVSLLVVRQFEITFNNWINRNPQN